MESILQKICFLKNMFELEVCTSVCNKELQSPLILVDVNLFIPVGVFFYDSFSCLLYIFIFCTKYYPFVLSPEDGDTETLV